MARERIRLPIDSDLSWSSFVWAAELLGEPIVRLEVTPQDAPIAQKLEVQFLVDETLPCFAWLLVGKTREVFSDGA